LGRLVEHDPHHLISAPRYCTGSVVLARLILGGCESKHRPHRLGLPETGRRIDRDAIGERDNRADTRDRHQAPAHIIVPDDGQQAPRKNAKFLANDRPDNNKRSNKHGKMGSLSTSSLIRASNFIVPIMPTLRPKLRRLARSSFSMAMAFDCSSLRWVSSTRSFWLRNVFTCTGRYSTARIICAMPRASLRSVLLLCAFSTARMWRVSTQITGKPASARTL